MWLLFLLLCCYSVAAEAGPGSVAWKFQAEPKSSILSTPVVSHGTVFFTTDQPGALYSLDAVKGTQKWKTVLGKDSFIEGTPCLADGILYVVDGDGCLHAVDAETGRVQWVFNSGLVSTSSPTAANGVVYFGSWDFMKWNFTIFAISAKSGKPLWSFLTNYVIGTPLFSPPNTIYVGADKLYSFKADSGNKNWEYDYDQDSSWVVSQPALFHGMLFVGNGDGNVEAHDAATGSLLWKYNTGDQVRGNPAVVDGIVYIGSESHQVYALSGSSGKLIWNFTTDGVIFYSSPVIAEGVLYIGSEDFNLYAIDTWRHGELLWKFGAGHQIEYSAAVANSLVFFGTTNGTLYALSTGK